jgi:hypothetical protein
MTTDGERESDLACGASFTRDDGHEGICTLLQDHPGGHTDLPAPPGPEG